MIDACQSAAEATELSKAGQDMFNEIEGLKTPVVAAIMGTAMGGGLEVSCQNTWFAINID